MFIQKVPAESGAAQVPGYQGETTPPCRPEGGKNYPIVISSRGSVTGGKALFSNRATAKEILPTLPQYIRKIIISLLRGRRSLVIPMVIPAVPIAEKVSNRTSVRAKG